MRSSSTVLLPITAGTITSDSIAAANTNRRASIVSVGQDRHGGEHVVAGHRFAVVLEDFRHQSGQLVGGELGDLGEVVVGGHVVLLGGWVGRFAHGGR
jgi:hypothetical protein